MLPLAEVAGDVDAWVAGMCVESVFVCGDEGFARWNQTVKAYLQEETVFFYVGPGSVPPII